MSYTITGNGYSRTGTIDISGPETSFWAAITEIPAGLNYQILLHALGSDGIPGTGSAMFDISPRATTTVSVVLRFVPPPSTDGAAVIDGTTNDCPCVSSLAAQPRMLSVGETSALSASASDRDHQPSPLTYTWTVSPSDIGALSDANSRNPKFTALAEGTARVTLTVSDGDAACESLAKSGNSLSVELMIAAPEGASSSAGDCPAFERPGRYAHALEGDAGR